MPILAGFLMSIFTGIFSIVAKKLAGNLAIATTYVATITAAYIAVSALLSSLSFMASAILPQPLVYVFSLVVPDSLPSILTALWVFDATITGWAWFQQRIPVLAQIAKL